MPNKDADDNQDKRYGPCELVGFLLVLFGVWGIVDECPLEFCGVVFFIGLLALLAFNLIHQFFQFFLAVVRETSQ